MSKDPAIYTQTMANVFFRQGHFDRAIEIYRYLLKRNPHQTDLLDALNEAEQCYEDQKSGNAKDLPALVSEWIELMQTYRLIKKLKQLSKVNNGNLS